MANPLSSKRLQIDKASATMVIVIAITAFITVFSLIACKALLGQRSYQSRVIGEKEKALNQLKTNNKAAQQLVDSYKVFVEPSNNLIGGTSAGSGDKDGDNARIILDALPSKYDFPALATSLNKLLTSNKSFKSTGISGTDDELGQAGSPASNTPKPIAIPFSTSVTGSSQGIQDFINTLQHSIRPIKVLSLTLNGNDASLNVSVSAETYYQPGKSVNITTKVVK